MNALQPILRLACGLALFSSAMAMGRADEVLPSWNENASREAVIDFVERVTREGGADFVPAPERIAVFDNDGTLWAEQPIYFQLAFALDRIRAMAPDHPEWKTEAPFQAVLEGDHEAILASGKEGLVKIVMASHANQTTEEFAAEVDAWVETARHPRFDRPYTELVYQPMLELLEYLRANDFKTYIVSGGGIDFMRVFAEEVYGIPPEQVVGTRIESKYEVRDGTPVIIRQPEIAFIDDKEGKPLGIHQHIGRRPIFAAGNSDGDFQMLEWTTTGEGPRFGLLVHHTDEEREWAYDRDSHIGKLVRGLDEAETRGWHLVDMKADWKTIFAPKPE